MNNLAASAAKLQKVYQAKRGNGFFKLFALFEMLEDQPRDQVGCASSHLDDGVDLQASRMKFSSLDWTT